VPFLGHNPYDGLDVSPDSAPPARSAHADPTSRARATVHRFAVDTDDERMLLDLLGLLETEQV
jgi:hypothetical protein